MADVSAFPGVTLPDAPLCEQPSKEVVEFLEELLADAKAGKIQAIGVAYVGPGDVTSDGYACGRNMSHAMFAAISDLFYTTARVRSERATVSSDSGNSA